MSAYVKSTRTTSVYRWLNGLEDGFTHHDILLGWIQIKCVTTRGVRDLTNVDEHNNNTLSHVEINKVGEGKSWNRRRSVTSPASTVRCICLRTKALKT